LCGWTSQRWEIPEAKRSNSENWQGAKKELVSKFSVKYLYIEKDIKDNLIYGNNRSFIGINQTTLRFLLE